MTTQETKTQFLDLDALLPAVEVTVKLGGKSHKLKQLSVQDFVANTADQQKLGEASTLAAEVETVVRMLHRAFPTITIEAFHKLELAKLYKLLSFALEQNGSDKASKEVAAEAKSDDENPQTAA